MIRYEKAGVVGMVDNGAHLIVSQVFEFDPIVNSSSHANVYWSLLNDNCVTTNITQVQALSSLKKHKFNNENQTQVFQIAFFNDFPGLLQIVGVLLVLISIVSFGFRGILADRQKNVTNIWARNR